MTVKRKSWNSFTTPPFHQAFRCCPDIWTIKSRSQAPVHNNGNLGFMAPWPIASDTIKDARINGPGREPEIKAPQLFLAKSSEIASKKSCTCSRKQSERAPSNGHVLFATKNA
jgi:hypothetical protein